MPWIVTPVSPEWQFSCWFLRPFLTRTPRGTLLPWNTLHLYSSLVGNGLIETLVTYIKIRCTHLCAQSSWGLNLSLWQGWSPDSSESPPPGQLPPPRGSPYSCAHPLPLVRFPCSAREWWAVPMETGTPGSSTVADSEVQSMCLWTPLLSRLNPNPFLERVLRRKSDIKQVKLQHFAHSRPSAERLVIRLTLFKPNPGYFLKKTPHWEL